MGYSQASRDWWVRMVVEWRSKLKAPRRFLLDAHVLVSEEIVELEGAMRGLNFEVWKDVTNLESHAVLVLL